MSKSSDFLKTVFLIDPESDEKARIVCVQGSEGGLDHLRIFTQSTVQRENGIATMHRIYSEECEFDNKKNEMLIDSKECNV